MADMLTLGISPCPNDTFVFEAWINGRLGSDAPPVSCCMQDISTLNEMALENRLDIVKVSFFAYAVLKEKYVLLNAGGAMGRGCGPLLVARTGAVLPRDDAMQDVRVAVPGKWTTANLLLSLWKPHITRKVYMPFRDIMPAVARGAVEAGVIIHEGRFTFAGYGLSMIEDLGAWWEKTTGLPIPLGGIVARRSLGTQVIGFVEETVRMSLQRAWSQPEAVLPFMRLHAGELDDRAITQHVALYVNSYSQQYGAEGQQAIQELLVRAASAAGAVIKGDEQQGHHSRNG